MKSHASYNGHGHFTLVMSVSLFFVAFLSAQRNNNDNPKMVFPKNLYIL